MCCCCLYSSYSPWVCYKTMLPLISVFVSFSLPHKLWTNFSVFVCVSFLSSQIEIESGFVLYWTRFIYLFFYIVFDDFWHELLYIFKCIMFAWEVKNDVMLRFFLSPFLLKRHIKCHIICNSLLQIWILSKPWYFRKEA